MFTFTELIGNISFYKNTATTDRNDRERQMSFDKRTQIFNPATPSHATHNRRPPCCLHIRSHKHLSLWAQHACVRSATTDVSMKHRQKKTLNDTIQFNKTVCFIIGNDFKSVSTNIHNKVMLRTATQHISPWQHTSDLSMRTKQKGGMNRTRGLAESVLQINGNNNY
jgi:hypothetical protein